MPLAAACDPVLVRQGQMSWGILCVESQKDGLLAKISCRPYPPASRGRGCGDIGDMMLTTPKQESPGAMPGLSVQTKKRRLILPRFLLS
jgi:hypothetical protein